MAPRRCLPIALSAAWLAAGAARADQAPPGREHKLSLSLATGVAYVRESWSPNDGNPGSVKTGWAPVVEVAVGRALSADLVVGGILQTTPLFDPTESFAGNTYQLTDQVDVVCLAGGFVEDPRLPRIPARAGIAVGPVASFLYDRDQDQLQTRVGVGVSPYVGYDRRVSGRWWVGLLARLTYDRTLAGNTPSSATAGRLTTSLLLTFTVR